MRNESTYDNIIKLIVSVLFKYSIFESVFMNSDLQEKGKTTFFKN